MRSSSLRRPGGAIPAAARGLEPARVAATGGAAKIQGRKENRHMNATIDAIGDVMMRNMSSAG